MKVLLYVVISAALVISAMLAAHACRMPGTFMQYHGACNVPANYLYYPLIGRPGLCRIVLISPGRRVPLATVQLGGA